jgi:hypothetical protein
MQSKNDIRFNMLLQSLQLLAASYEQQLQAFPDFVHVPDEIALIFEDVCLFLDEIAHKGLITLFQKVTIEQLNKALDQMSEDKELWTLSSLQTSPQWENIRYMANGLLESLHESKHNPQLFWLHYFPKKTN